jgi:predicted transcriptional regulator/transcriptional regulator with XRE-family HTH domain
MKDKKIFAGDRIRRRRDNLGLKQAALAAQAGISASYLNQIEADQRPLTRRLLARLSQALDVPETYFVDGADTARAAHLREALGDPVFRGHKIDPEELAAMIRAAPQASDAFMALYLAYTAREEVLREAPDQPKTANLAARFAYDEVRDWVQSRKNHFAPLDRAAETLFETAGFDAANLREDLTRYLRDTHGITVASGPGLLAQGAFWRLDNTSGILLLAEDAASTSRVFWMAHVVGQLSLGPLVEREIRGAGLSSDEARGLARIALGNYFAGALMMPYGRFLDQAIAVRYDLQKLQTRFGASFEQVCHRLSTLQRPERPGIPFYFAKTDIAGNILKRSSATRFEFAQFGGPCPLWNVYRAFARPGEILVQLAITPDQVSYLNIARTVGRDGGAFLSRPRAVAVVLGCEVQHAAQTVYAAGLALNNPEAADPIGPGCRACERTSCRHRSVPPTGRKLDIGTAERGMVPYRVSGDGKEAPLF